MIIDGKCLDISKMFANITQDQDLPKKRENWPKRNGNCFKRERKKLLTMFVMDLKREVKTFGTPHAN